MPEVEEIKARYERRALRQVSSGGFSEFVFRSRNERELVASRWLHKHMKPPLSCVLEIGAGFGDNYHFLRRAGFGAGQIYFNELLKERLDHLQSWMPANQLLPGDICELDSQFDGQFDLVFQSTVLSSILEQKNRDLVLQKVQRLLKPGGLFLSYDFTYNNPQNRDVKALTLGDLRNGLGNFELVDQKRVTLAPPIGRRVGRTYGFYNALFPFLRTHLLTLWLLKTSSQEQAKP